MARMLTYAVTYADVCKYLESAEAGVVEVDGTDRAQAHDPHQRVREAHHPPSPVRRRPTSAYVSIRQHTYAYVSLRQHTSAYVREAHHPPSPVRKHPESNRLRPHTLVA
jgi:hypothetical protein